MTRRPRLRGRLCHSSASNSFLPTVLNSNNPPSSASGPHSAKQLRTKLTQALSGFNKGWVRCLVLAIIGIAVRVPALQGEPIWDDSFLARDNPLIKSPVLFFETFRHYLQLDSFSAHYRPMQNISYMLDYAVWHTNWYGFHL